MPNVFIAIKYRPGKKTWVAAIGGKSEKFGVDRNFINAFGGSRKRGGTGEAEYLLREGGLYELCGEDERVFVQVRNGDPVTISREEMLAILETIEAKKQSVTDDIDARIARINGEGGIEWN